jgi:hypothetical protein
MNLSGWAEITAEPQMSKPFEPPYLKWLQTGELEERVRQAGRL